MAIYQDKVFVATTDARLVALDARTGKPSLGRRPSPIARRATPTPPGRWSSRASWSTACVGCDRYGNDGCWISGYDAGDRQAAVEVQHRRRGTGEPGADTWGKLADNLRIGGETWIAGSYDPDLDLTYWGVAQAKPWMRASRGTSNFDNVLYTSSTVALRPKDGTLAWHYQHAPGESLDLDEVFERVLVDIGDQKVRVHDRQAGHPVEARSPHRPVPRLQGNDLPERLRVDRSEDRRADVSRRHPRAADRPVGRLVPEHRRRPQLAGDELSCRRAACWSFRSASRAWRCRAARSSSRTDRAAPAPIAASSRCPAATATSASSPPTT